MSDPWVFSRRDLVTPLVEACRQRGLFTLLDRHEFRHRTWLIAELAANAGYFTIALDALESAGWLEKNGDDAYRLTDPAEGEAGRAPAPFDSYRPVLDALPELLFGDHARAFRTIRAGRADEDLQQQIVELFDREPLDEQQLQFLATTFFEVDAEQPVNAGLAVLAADQPAHYVDRDGRLLDGVAVLSGWQQHLRALRENAGESRLQMLEAHASPADWIQRLAHQYPIGAEAFLTLAASVGLFDGDGVKRHPRSSDPCRFSLHVLAKRDYVIRHAAEGDLDRLEQLEELCWQHTQTPRQQILSRLQNYPQGQFVLERDGTVLGVIYSQRIATADALMSRTAADVHELHDPSGSIVQLLAVNLVPQAQNASYGDQLLEFMLQRCSLMTGIEQVVGVTLCKRFDAAGSASFDEYIRWQGSSQDPVLAFHWAHGAQIVKAIPGYRPEDHANRNNGVLVAYDILNRPQRRGVASPNSEAAGLDRQHVARFVQGEAARLLGLGESELDPDRPVMEMGLDSADLLQLQRLCEERFGLQLQAGFFFEHSSIGKVIEYLAARLAVTPEQGSLVIPAAVQDDRVDPDRIAATDVAIVGMACKLPGGIETPEDLWRVLASGECVIGSFPKSRRGWPGGTEFPGIDRGGFVDDGDAFDAAFFRISPAEAQITDPQQRMLMQLAWACLEDAGILPALLKGLDTGVFVGASNCDYSRLVQEAGVEIEAHNGVGSSLAILANRISYFFDLSGPSLVIDTACSSSLMALHSAVQSLRSGECASALVGGVNFICHPDLSIAYHKAGMLAPDGRCKVFDAGADGYVRAEGAVVLLLKPLWEAIAGHDRIHAVIRGSATNHGGLAGGLTVPNPQKQKELLVTAWKDAGVAARDLTYLEAHGTGTSLGDPIEIEGIQAACADSGPERPAASCGIGSVKGNLGHLESAAGITGLLKVILSLRHQQLPASVNFTRLNPKIRLEGSPLAIQDRLQEWSAGQPRVAGVSSFGSGGANAHVVVQEYPARLSGSDEEDYLFVLSAADGDRLRAYAVRVIEWLEKEATAFNFADAIFTWQTGRTAMKQRLAIKVKNHLDLLNRLQQWLAGIGDAADVWSGQPEQKDSALARMWQTKSGRQLIGHALLDRDLDALGALWATGTEIDWRRYYERSARKPQPASVPTYPFAKDRYWIEPAASRQRVVTAAVIHPLLHTNTSDLSRQSYSATFTGEEFFLSDHQIGVDGRTVQKVLPAVAYLEMTRAAIERAVPSRPESTMLELRNTVWIQPIVVTGKQQVSIALSAGDDEQIEYEIYSEDAERRSVHCQGRAVLSPRAAPVGLDLEQLEGTMGRAVTEADGVYAAYARMGLVYGPAFRTITAIHQGNGQVLVRLRLPRQIDDTSADFVLHPSVMDGAMQAAVGFVDGWSGAPGEPRLPFALESLCILAPCTREMVAWVRYSPGSQAGDKVVKLDIDLCDEQGNVCVQMHGFSSRVKDVDAIGSLLATPVWQPGEAGLPAGNVDYTQHHVVLCELPKVDVEQQLSLNTGGEADVAQRYSDYAVACFERIQTILQGKPQGQVLFQIAVAGEGEHVLLAGLSGLLKTAALENPQFTGQLLLVPADVTAGELRRRLDEEKSHGLDLPVRYTEGARQVLRWQEVAAAPEPWPVGFNDQGVYLITGGLGGLGVLFAQEILGQTRGARVVLTGRSALSSDRQAVLDTLSVYAGRVSYRQVELGDAEQVRQLIAAVKEEFGQLTGILHCAGMIADSFILRKDSAQFREVLAPKVAGTYNLDQASRDVALDFFVLFSSINGAMGNVGQADYAAANGFMDQFAAYRNRQVAAGQRYGRTRSIDWPFWQAGGMTMDPASLELLQRATGLQPMQTATGLRAFHRSLALPYDQILVVEGDLARMRHILLDSVAVPAQPRAEQPAMAELEPETAVEKIQEYLRKQFSAVLKLPAQKIDPRTGWAEYGIDSMLAVKLTNQLEKTFGSLSKTLFFEYQTISDLTGYFVSQHAPQLAALFASAAPRAGKATPVAVPAASATPVAGRRFLGARSVAPAQAAESDGIAIIGLSGRYPGALDVDAYWENLREGRDSVIEVPRERWDWREYYSEDRSSDGRHYSKWGGFMSGVDEFDPLFFNIAPKEAKYIDPQERLFLQHAWMAIEDAGYTRAGLQMPDGQDLPGQVGVYAGVMWSEYQLFGAAAGAEGLRMGFAGNPASIANRVSYALNLHGPSMTLDTMCSSSLTAMHVACEDLKHGRTSLAIAGGVNVSVHPHKYLMLSVGQFISSDGHCQSFGEGGDGYIPGEGVGVVVLKRLSEAERDGDHIYGVIRGSALTHGGKTSGYTVPNLQAQASAVSRALVESGINARHVSYVEAHGTGTKLGDPIEIAALSRAFEPFTNDTGFCPIGSAKSNIGHCESAAGMAGLTKILLQMQHRQIVPSLHSAQLNPHIDFARGPFVVHQELSPWEQPVIDGRTLPRIAGLSSFGAGGSNAHMIVEEYPLPVQQPAAFANVAILLSARTPEQLQQKAVELLAFVGARASTIDLVAVAYTLQLGREAMEERVGFVVSSVDELARKLQAFAAGEPDIEDTWRGQAKRNKEALALFSTDVDLKQAIDTWIANGKLPRLVDLWAKGLEVDWSGLYREARPRRVSLPTYPFAKDRHWIDVPSGTPAAASAASVSAPAAVLHPLLHDNVSDLSEQRYRSTFTGEELFFAEVLSPGAYLEMARAAAAHAWPERPESTVLELHDVVWGEPIVAAGNKQVSIALSPRDPGQIEYEIYSRDGDQELVHGQGRVVLSREPAPAALDLQSLKESGQLLAELRLPDGLESSSGDYVLHPAMIDLALEAATGLIDGQPRQPVALESIRVVWPCSGEMVAWLRHAPGRQTADIDLCDRQGNVAVQMRGVSWTPQSTIAEPVHDEIALRPAASPVLVPMEREKPSAIALAPLHTIAPPAWQVPRGKPVVTLSNAALAVQAGENQVSPVHLYDCGDGTFSIEITASRAKDMIGRVLEALERAQQEPALKVLIVSGIEYWFPIGGRRGYNEAVERKLFHALVSFPSPVVAVLPGDATGAGLLAAALCDFMVCSENSEYGYRDMDLYPTPAVAALFAERFGDAQARHFLYASTSSTGRQLRARGWTCPVLPWAEVEAHARQLASTLAAKSPDALRLLKAHLTRRVAALVDALTTLETPAEHIQLEPAAERVRVIRPGAGDLVADLARAIGEAADYRAIVLAGDGSEFLPVTEEVVLEVQRLLLDAELPVIAALNGNAGGNAWLIAQFCDAAVYSRQGVYSAAGVGLAPMAAAVFAERFGSEAAGEILLAAADHRGVDLQQRVGALSVADHDDVVAEAVQVAASWAALPRAILADWKRHAAATLREKIRGLPAGTGPGHEAHERLPAAPTRIDLQSAVVTATAHPEGIVVVKLEDRDAKNMFSDALVAGVTEAFTHIRQSSAYKVVILTGYDSYFASGGTRETLLAIQQGTARFTDVKIFQAALDCELPVIAAMQGHGIGAGWSMGMFADLVLLGDESRYVSPYMDYGFTPGAGATVSLAWKMGQDLARESLFTAREYAGRELKERGLAPRVLPRAEVVPAAMALARQIVRAPRQRLIGLKQQLALDVRQQLEEVYRRELVMHDQTFVGRSDTLTRIQERFHQETETPRAAPAAGIPVDTDALRSVSATLKTLLAHELQIAESEVDDDAQFVDLGLDSISGVTWVRKINAKYQTSIEATKIYAYPTLAQLSRYTKEEAEKHGSVEDRQSCLSGQAELPLLHHHRTLTSRRGAAVSRFAATAPATRRPEPIAIIGMAGQFPQARNLEEFWENIAGGKNCIAEVPRERWDVDAFYQPGDPRSGKTSSRWAGLLEDYDRFDPLFFNISPTEAEDMDPQQRLFLQACWHAIEDAGYAARSLSGSRTGVFAGCANGDYHQLSREHQLSAQGFTGSAMSILAARIAYFLNLHGPCVSIDTACSSSLVSIANACDSLTSGASDLALAGGVYVMVGPEMHIKTSQAGMLSPDGRCFTFDQRANGFVPGEGVGVVLLKRLADAERDRDIIHAVLHGWGVNQDGKTNGITAPNPESQTRLEQELYDRFDIDPAGIQLVEAHGTGTRLGDPIEVEGLKKAFARYTGNKEYCALGSVKSNIGHCLAAAGVAGLLKVVLALEHRQLPPTINFERLNEHIDLKDSPFYIETRLREWEPGGAAGRRAATSSFGFSGTNAQLVLGEHLPPAAIERSPGAVNPEAATIIPLSARKPEQLQQKARELLDFIRRQPPLDLAAMAYTLQAGREPMEERLGIVADSVEQLAEKLEAHLQGRAADVHRGRAKRSTESAGIIGLGAHRLLELWVDGLEIDWPTLYGQVTPRRIALPAYPFARERYWIDPPSGGQAILPVLASGQAGLPVLHPLLQHRYTSTFTGEELFLTDHRIGTQKLLPGVAYLEMARAAMEQAWPRQAETSIVELHDHVWLEPIAVTEPRQVSIVLRPAEDDRVDYEISSTDGGQETVYCRGQGLFSRGPAPPRIDVERLGRRMSRDRWEAADVYAVCARMGLHYGPAHQGITAIELGEQELLAHLRLPAVAEAGAHDYVLHPSLMDSALQASIGLIVDRNDVPATPSVPFAVESLHVISPCTKEMIAWVRYADGSRRGDRAVKVDVELCDPRGNIHVQVRGFTLRALESVEESPRFDEAFYETLLDDIADRRVSVDEALAAG